MTDTRRTATVHQPHFLPWPPYLGRLILSDHFVVLDDVPFRKNYYQNRTRLLSPGGDPFWLTLPVPKQRNLIRATTTSPPARTLSKWKDTFRQFYGRSLGWGTVWPALEQFIAALQDGEFGTVYQASLASIKLLFQLLERNAPSIRRSSEFRHSDERTEHLIECTAGVGAEILLLGWGGSSESAVHDLPKIRRNGITIAHLLRSRATQVAPEFVVNAEPRTWRTYFCDAWVSRTSRSVVPGKVVSSPLSRSQRTARTRLERGLAMP